MTDIVKLTDVIDNPLYLRGKLEGVKSLISNTDFDDERIAFLFGVTTELVKKTREDFFKESLLNKNKDVTTSKNETFFEKHKKDFTRKLVLCIQEQDFEYGVESMADNTLNDALKVDIFSTKTALNEVFIENFNKSSILVGILQVVSRQPAEVINPQGLVMATEAIRHQNLEVRECAIRCFENWTSIETLNILENIKTTPAWLQDYVNVVIKNMKEELCLIS